MLRHPECLAAITCGLLCVIWRIGYPLTSWAAIMPMVALLLVGGGIFLRHTALTLALREGVFLPQSRYKKWFRGYIGGAILALTQGAAIVLAMSHFTLHARPPELILAAGIGAFTLFAIAMLRRFMARHLHPRFAVAASAWVAVALALLFYVPYYWMQQHILPPPAYLDAGNFPSVLQSALDQLPPRRDGIIEALSAMQILEAAIRWMLHSLDGVWGASWLLFIYNASICIAIGRFFSDAAATFHLVR